MDSSEQVAPSDWNRESSATRNMLLGSGVLALGSYLLLAYASRQLSGHEYSLFAAFWSVVMGLVLGATAPLETFGLSSSTVFKGELSVSKQFESAVKFVFVIVFVAILVVLPWTVPRVFDGHWSFLLATVIVLVGFITVYASRGILIVEHRSRRYAELMSLESILRIALAALFILFIGPAGSSIALAVSIAAFMAGILGFLSIRQHISFKSKEFGKSSKGEFTPLLTASMATLLLLNLGPFLVQFISGADAAAAGPFLNALTLSRVPIMLGPILQARLVPTVVAILSRESFPSLKQLIGRGMRLLIIGGLLFVIIFALAGQQLINILFSTETSLNRLDLVLLSLPTLLYLIAIAFQSVLVAMKSTKNVARAWIAGLGMYATALALPFEPILKVEIAGFVGLSTVSLYLYRNLTMKMAKR